jgi:TRAP-type C4-dicarboxylate transport system permease small subunit
MDRLTTRVAGHAAVLMLVIAVASGLFQVLARFLLNTPSDWTEVVTRFALIWMVYLGISVALRQGAMVSVDLLHRSLPKQWRRSLDVVIAACVLSLLGIMAYWGAQIAWRIRFQSIAGLEVSMSWAYLAIPVGAAFAAIAVLAHFFDPQNHELETAT